MAKFMQPTWRVYVHGRQDYVQRAIIIEINWSTELELELLMCAPIRCDDKVKMIENL